MSTTSVSSNKPSYVSNCWNTICQNKGKVAAAATVVVGVTAATVASYIFNTNTALLTAALEAKCNIFSGSSTAASLLAKNECEKAAANVLEICSSFNLYSGQCDQAQKDFNALRYLSHRG